MDDSHLPSLIEILSTLLRDRSPLSIGSVAIAFEVLCPTRLDLLHPHFRRLCRVLVDVDEWGQVNLVELLTRYARTMLPKPSIETGMEGQGVELDKDLELLLRSMEPLLQSRNHAVRHTCFVLKFSTHSYIGCARYFKGDILFRTSFRSWKDCGANLTPPRCIQGNRTCGTCLHPLHRTYLPSKLVFIFPPSRLSCD